MTQSRLGFIRGGWRASLPAGTVLHVSAAAPALPLPFADAALEGAAALHGAIIPHLGLPAPGPAPVSGHAVDLATSRGAVRIVVDRVERGGGDAPCALPIIEALLAGLQGAGPLPRPARTTEPPADAVLILSAGAQRLAIPAAQAQFVAPAGTLVRGEAGWVVEAGGRLHRCRLPDEADPAAARPRWAVIRRTPDGSEAVLADGVTGPHRVAPGQILALGAQAWLRQPDDALIPLLGAAPTDPVAGPAVSARPDAPAMIAVHAGPFRLMLHAAQARAASITVLHARRRRGDAPVFDAACLLGAPAGPPAARLLLLRRAGRVALGLLVARAWLAGDDGGWGPAPPGPNALRALFDGARPADGACWLRLRGDLPSRPPAGLNLAAAFRGWAGQQAEEA